MRTPLPVNDKKSFRDDLFEKLANDYLLKGTSSVLALFLTEDIQESVDRLRKEAGSDGQEALADNVSAIPRFCYYYQLFQENSANPQKVFACFSEILRTIARRSAPFFYEEKFDELYRKMTFVLRGFKSAPLMSESRCTGRSRDIPEGRCKSKSALQKRLKAFCRNLPEVQEAYEACFQKPEYIQMLDNLFALLECNLIHFKVHTFLYDSGYQIKHNALHPLEQVKETGRARKTDKTMKLLEKCQDMLGLPEEAAPEAFREKCCHFYEALIEQGRSEEEYRNLFIPLIHDRLTGVALCIVGRDYIEDYMETFRESERYAGFMKNKIPCELLVLSLKYDSDNAMTPSSVFYEYADYTGDYALYGKMPEDFKPADYFYSIYQIYLEQRNRALDLMRELEMNHLTKFPEEVDSLFSKYFNQAPKGNEAEKQLSEACLENYGNEYDRQHIG